MPGSQTTPGSGRAPARTRPTGFCLPSSENVGNRVDNRCSRLKAGHIRSHYRRFADVLAGACATDRGRRGLLLFIAQLELSQPYSCQFSGALTALRPAHSHGHRMS